MFILHNSLSFQLWIKFFFCTALRASDFASALESIPFPRATVPIVVFLISLPQLYHYHRGPVVHYIWPLLFLESFIPLHVKNLLRASLTAAFFSCFDCSRVIGQVGILAIMLLFDSSAHNYFLCMQKTLYPLWNQDQKKRNKAVKVNQKSRTHHL